MTTNRAANPERPARACVLLAEGFEEIEAITVIDVLRRAEVETVTASLGDRDVLGGHGIVVRADRTLDDIAGETFDALVLPGGLGGATRLRDDPRVQRLVADQDQARRLLAAICAAPIALSRAGALRGRTATSYPGFEDQIECASYATDLVVVDGHVVTSRGPGTALAFAFELLRRLGNEAQAAGLRERMLAP